MGDVERLAEVLGTSGIPMRGDEMARLVLRSDWLAAHDAEVAADARREALREAADEKDTLTSIEALAIAEPPTSPYTDVAEAALWRVGYTDAQTAILRVLLDARPDPQPEYDASGLPTSVLREAASHTPEGGR